MRGELRCCTEGNKSTCSGTFDGKHHNGHGRLSTLFLLDQELNLAFCYIVANPPPNTDGTTDLLECLLKYGAALVRSAVPPSYNICPEWTEESGTPMFRDFQLQRSRNVTQFQQSHPRQVSRVYLPIPPWTPDTNEVYAEMLRTPHFVGALLILHSARVVREPASLVLGILITAVVLSDLWKLQCWREIGCCQSQMKIEMLLMELCRPVTSLCSTILATG